MRDMEFFNRIGIRRRGDGGGWWCCWGGLTLVLVIGMGTHRVLADRNIAGQKKRDPLRGQLEQTNELVEMDKLDAMRQQLKQQEKVVSRLGFYVYATKAMDTLDRMLPKQMRRPGCRLRMRRRRKPRRFSRPRLRTRAVDRKLKIRIQGVCPTDVDLADFMTQLSTVSFFDQVSVTYAGTRAMAGMCCGSLRCRSW